MRRFSDSGRLPAGTHTVEEIWWGEEARIEERQKIAYDLHDTVIQPLAALVTSLECLQHPPTGSGVTAGSPDVWKELEELAREAIDSLRATLCGLRAHPHARLGLPQAIQHHLVPQLTSRGVRVTCESRSWPADLPLDCTSNLYLFVREALTNVEKHARATEARVLLQAASDALYILIADNGAGFHFDGTTRMRDQSGRRLGITSMRERARMLGGRLDITTTQDRGTRLELCLMRPDGSDAPSGGGAEWLSPCTTSIHRGSVH